MIDDDDLKMPKKNFGISLVDACFVEFLCKKNWMDNKY